MENVILQHGRAVENRRKKLGGLIHTEVIDSGGSEKRLRPPKERVHHSMRRGRMKDASNPLVLESGRGGRARERDEKRRVGEDRKEVEGSLMSS